MSKSKIVRITNTRRPKPHEIARARAKASPLADRSNNFVLSGAALELGGELVKNITGGGSKITKKKFYQYRDSVYDKLKAQGRDFAALPGNPFGAFAHSAIKDSPLKDYRAEYDRFNEVLREYYPDVFANAQNKIASEPVKTPDVRPDMQAPSDQKILMEILQGVSEDYINELKHKEATGEPMSDVEKKILSAYRKLDKTVRDAVMKKGQQKVGEWIMDNWYIVALAIVVLIMVMKKR